eukprot:362387-Chlamydomonas_euryale.AAC.8
MQLERLRAGSFPSRCDRGSGARGVEKLCGRILTVAAAHPGDPRLLVETRRRRASRRTTSSLFCLFESDTCPLDQTVQAFHLSSTTPVASTTTGGTAPTSPTPPERQQAIMKIACIGAGYVGGESYARHE